jgi:hypothetical protein
MAPVMPRWRWWPETTFARIERSARRPVDQRRDLTVHGKAPNRVTLGKAGGVAGAIRGWIA